MEPTLDEVPQELADIHQEYRSSRRRTKLATSLTAVNPPNVVERGISG